MSMLTLNDLGPALVAARTNPQHTAEARNLDDRDTRNGVNQGVPREHAADLTIVPTPGRLTVTATRANVPTYTITEQGDDFMVTISEGYALPGNRPALTFPRDTSANDFAINFLRKSLL
ncbi:hypothetical protein BIV57_17890 [Mangrovactinospora gilvigrisea]|uniref:Uncharacterized protein n=1 Tax=Mangrovactinospora gilvigrisea TaxID=1428644 RepID=A0A1J7BBZ1_9ACTN|nr:hypothetical protein [Mangrovactinospora gilvigrisea]OIV36109.1 hypothetical protein BIV57_17890 [Mangrovactinospora gilvigrisea]